MFENYVARGFEKKTWKMESSVGLSQADQVRWPLQAESAAYCQELWSELYRPVCCPLPPTTGDVCIFLCSVQASPAQTEVSE